MGGTQISGRSDPLGFSHGFSLHADTVAYANPVVEATLGGAEVDLGRSRTHTPHIPTCAQGQNPKNLNRQVRKGAYSM